MLCDDGVYRPGSSCYFPGKSVAAALADSFPTARPLADHERSTSTFYEWLGVARDPRLPDVVARVTRIAGGPSDPRARTAVADVIGYLGKQMPDRGAPPPDTLKALRDLAWLPVRGDSGWHAPPQVNSAFREQLFATQGRFLDVPRPVQQSAADFLSWLGVEANPTASQVVAHLLTRARQHEPVSPDVYTELNRKYDDPSIPRLRDTACLLIDGRYLRPEAVFRGANPFGRFRQRLGPGFDAIGDLLDVLGVKRMPGPEDAIAVLTDIAHEQEQRSNTPVEDPDDLAVVWQCWQMLDMSLAAGEIDETRLAQLGRLAVIPDDTSVLTPPSRLLIDDMPGVASTLNVGRSVIRRKEGMWRAFQAAGVQSFTEAVTVETIQLNELTRAGMVHARVHQRAPAFRRILDGVPEGHQRLTATLATLEFPESPLLRVRYHLPAFGLTSPETELRALYVPAQEEDSAQLISCPGPGDARPWMLIAKELARALYPGNAPGLLSSSLYVVLDAESLDMAHRALDDAGMPRLEHVDFTVTDSGPDAQFGDTRDEGVQPDGDTDTFEGARSGQPDQPDAPAEPPDAENPAGEESGSKNPASQADDQDRPDNPEPDDRAPGKDDRADPPGSDPADRQRPRGRLRSYVNPGNKEGASRDHRDTSSVDEAGIERVLRAELAAGRHPELMPHNNPGFDIISRDEQGEVVRHIEVKSVSGAWDALGVGLTRTQFDFGRQHPETFWLYVVEHALDDERAQIRRIADPAGQAQEFLFDGGWSALSDPDSDGGATNAAPALSWPVDENCELVSRGE